MSNAVTMSVAAPNNGTRSSAFFATSIRVSGSMRPRALSTSRIVPAASASMLSRTPELDQRIAGVIGSSRLIRGGGAWRANLG